MAELYDDLEQRYGLVRIGGDLAPTTLVQAYCNGVFPWFDDDCPICWWSPDPRAIFELPSAQPLTPGPSPQRGEGGRQFHVSRRLARTIRSGKFRVTINRAFGDVIHGCAQRDEGTWLTSAMIEAYQRLHRFGIAHSVEAWYGEQLGGGLYGVALGGFFAGESMFHRVTDASKVALAFTMDHLRERGFRLFDTQFLTAHTARLGAIEIPRRDYLERLQQALRIKTLFVEE